MRYALIAVGVAVGTILIARGLDKLAEGCWP
jgi:hypothetical protein